jgi:hypothetical protein
VLSATYFVARISDNMEEKCQKSCNRATTTAAAVYMV